MKEKKTLKDESKIDFEETIFQVFFKDTKKKNHRYKSWVHCYKFFRKRPKNSNKIEKWLDLAALNLSMYLASWGMWRGSTFSIDLDYKFYKYAVDIIIKKEFDSLWNLDISKWEQKDLKESISPIITKLINQLKNGLKQKLKKSGSKKTEKNVTDTLITKIIMGTIGCLPAFDKFFRDGKKGIKIITCKLDTKRKNAFNSLIDFYFEVPNKVQLDRVKDKIDSWEKKNYGNDCIAYPIMKLIDMHFWIRGKNKNDKKKELAKQKS